MKRGPPISGPRPPYCLIGAATCICFRARRARFCASTTTHHGWHPLRLLCSDDLGRERPGAVARCSPPKRPRSSLIDICAHLAPRTQPISRRAALARRCSNTSSFGQLQGPQQSAAAAPELSPFGAAQRRTPVRAMQRRDPDLVPAFIHIVDRHSIRQMNGLRQPCRALRTSKFDAAHRPCSCPCSRVRSHQHQENRKPQTANRTPHASLVCPHRARRASHQVRGGTRTGRPSPLPPRDYRVSGCASGTHSDSPATAIASWESPSSPKIGRAHV